MIGLLIGACAACAGVIVMSNGKKQAVGRQQEYLDARRELPSSRNPDTEIPYVPGWVDEWTSEGRARNLRGEDLTLYVLRNAFGLTHSGQPIQWPAKSDPYLIAFQKRVSKRIHR